MPYPARVPGVRKVYLDAPQAGSSTPYWEAEWAEVDLEATRARLVAGDPVVRRLARYLTGVRGPVLEAGCGTGAVAAALGDLGHRTVGVDLADAALRPARAVWPDVRGAVGDVRHLPFPDRSFGAVVSIGVLEHDEAGPADALREHRRVLRPDGIFLVTVPRISPVKAGRDTWNLRVRRHDGYRSRGRWVVRRDAIDREPSPWSFHQYEFSRSTWHRMLAEAGFEVVGAESHLVGAGLGDLPFLARRGGRRDPDRGTGDAAASAAATPSGPISPPPAGMIGRWKRAVTSEQSSGPVEGALVRAACHLVGHMDLTVARRI
jgi:SAM-dependent methyltransferase